MTRCCLVVALLGVGCTAAVSNAPGTSLRVLTADVDSTRFRTGMVSGAAGATIRCPTIGGQCVRAAEGPLVVTDLLPRPGSKVTAFVAMADGQVDDDKFAPRWVVGVNTAHSGMRLYVEPGEKLYLGIAPDGEAGAAPGAVWSGYHPY